MSGGLFFELFERDVGGVAADDGFGGTPHLHHVVFGGAADEPGVVLVEAEVGDAVGVAAVDE